MGKQRRQRKKFHQSPNTTPSEKNHADISMDTTTTTPLATNTFDNIFANIKIDYDALSKDVSDDMKSVKSYKSLKSEIAKEKPLSKKDKLLLRRQMFLQKLDTINQKKQEEKLRNKRKKTAIIGDTNPLRDALPSLESLLKSRPNLPYKSTTQQQQQRRMKGIEKLSKQKKNLLQGINIYKQIAKNKQFQKNPLEMVTKHVKAYIEHEQNSGANSGGK